MFPDLRRTLRKRSTFFVHKRNISRQKWVKKKQRPILSGSDQTLILNFVIHFSTVSISLAHFKDKIIHFKLEKSYTQLFGCSIGCNFGVKMFGFCWLSHRDIFSPQSGFSRYLKLKSFLLFLWKLQQQQQQQQRKN